MFSGLPHKADSSESACDVAEGPENRHGVYDFFCASGLATSRAQSIKSCAIGLSVRFFKVTTPTGPCRIGRSTGKVFNPKRVPLNFSVEAESTDRKRPVVSKALNS